MDSVEGDDVVESGGHLAVAAGGAGQVEDVDLAGLGIGHEHMRLSRGGGPGAHDHGDAALPEGPVKTDLERADGDRGRTGAGERTPQGYSGVALRSREEGRGEVARDVVGRGTGRRCGGGTGVDEPREEAAAHDSAVGIVGNADGGGAGGTNVLVPATPGGQDEATRGIDVHPGSSVPEPYAAILVRGQDVPGRGGREDEVVGTNPTTTRTTTSTSPDGPRNNELESTLNLVPTDTISRGTLDVGIGRPAAQTNGVGRGIGMRNGDQPRRFDQRGNGPALTLTATAVQQNKLVGVERMPNEAAGAGPEADLEELLAAELPVGGAGAVRSAQQAPNEDAALVALPPDGGQDVGPGCRCCSAARSRAAGGLGGEEGHVAHLGGVAAQQRLAAVAAIQHPHQPVLDRVHNVRRGDVEEVAGGRAGAVCPQQARRRGRQDGGEVGDGLHLGLRMGAAGGGRRGGVGGVGRGGERDGRGVGAAAAAARRCASCRAASGRGGGKAVGHVLALRMAEKLGEGLHDVVVAVSEVYWYVYRYR